MNNIVIGLRSVSIHAQTSDGELIATACDVNSEKVSDADIA